MNQSTISIQFNGESIELAHNATIATLLEVVGMRSKLVAVEVNLEIVPQAEHPSHQLQNGDVIEAVTLVGGG